MDNFYGAVYKVRLYYKILPLLSFSIQRKNINRKTNYFHAYQGSEVDINVEPSLSTSWNVETSENKLCVCG